MLKFLRNLFKRKAKNTSIVPVSGQNEETYCDFEEPKGAETALIPEKEYPTIDNYDALEFEIVDKKLVSYLCKTNAPIDEIKIPEGVTGIGKDAFKVTVKKIVVPKSVRHIEENGLPMLCNIDYLGSISDWCQVSFVNHQVDHWLKYSIHEITFNGNKLTGKLILSDDVSDIPPYTFRNSDIEQVEFSTSIQTISEGAFRGCSKLSKVILNEGLRIIEKNAFRGCPIRSVSVPDSVERIEGGAFAFCEDLESVVIGEKSNLKELNCTSDWEISEEGGLEGKVGVFYKCDMLKKLLLPSNLKVLSTIPRSLKTICWDIIKLEEPCQGWYKIYNNKARNRSLHGLLWGVEEVHIGRNARELFPFAQIGPLKQISVDEENEAYAFEDGIVYNKNKTKVILCLPSIEGRVIIPEGVEEIGARAFAHCQKVTEVQLPDSLRKIGSYAFYKCYELKQIEFPPNLVECEYACFSSYLEKIIIPEGMDFWNLETHQIANSNMHLEICCAKNKKSLN